MFPKMFAVAILVLSIFAPPSFAAQSVDINNADAMTIAENLNGIGAAKAKAIVAYRAEHGVFVDAQDLIKVKGIGVKLVERNRSLISFGKNVSVSKPVVAEKPKAGQPSSSVAPVTNAVGAQTTSTETSSQPQSGS